MLLIFNYLKLIGFHFVIPVCFFNISCALQTNIKLIGEEYV